MMLLKNARIRRELPLSEVKKMHGGYDEVMEGSILIKNGKIERIFPKGTEHELLYSKNYSKNYLGSSLGSSLENSLENPLENSPEKCRVIDVRHNLVMPGIIEAHCHIGITEEKKSKEGDDCNETVRPITPLLRAIDAVNTMDAAFHEAIKSGITSVMTGPGSSNVVGGQFAFIKTSGRRIDDLIVKAPAAMKIAFGENPKVNYGGAGASPATRMAIAGMLRDELVKARNYLEAYDSGRAEYSLHYEAWRPVFEKKIPLKAHAHRVDDIYTAIRIAKEFGLDMTLDHCSEGHLIAEDIAREGFPAIVGPTLASRNKIEVQNVDFKTAGILERAGVRLSVMTDHPVSLIQSLPLCVGLCVKNGLSLDEGYRALTINAAQICGVDCRVGSLEEGKDADIAVFDNNPMEVFTRCLMTIIDGRIVYEDEKW